MSKNIINFEDVEKNAKIRDSKINYIYEELSSNNGFSKEEKAMMLQVLNKISGGEEYFIGKKRKPSDRVKFVQIITDNINYLCKIGYLSNSEKAFLMDLVPYIEFKTNILIEKINKQHEFSSDSATPSYLAKELSRDRSKISKMMNGLMYKGILAVAESGTTTEDGRTCTLI